MSKPVCAVIGIGPKNGESFARRFSDEGYAVALLSRSTGHSEKLAAELGDAKAYACDVTDASAIESAFASIAEDLGDVDVLVYNAGSGVWGDPESISPDDFERTWRINSLGALHASRAVIPAMKAKGAGNIVFIGATASLRGKPMTTAFASAKAAQRSLAQSLARHLGPRGVHVSLVIIDGMIGEPGDPGADDGSRLDPNHIADAVVGLTKQPKSAWSFEIDVRPFAEQW